MDNISDELLVEAYNKAKELCLNKDFIKLLEMELMKRSIPIPK